MDEQRQRIREINDRCRTGMQHTFAGIQDDLLLRSTITDVGYLFDADDFDLVITHGVALQNMNSQDDFDAVMNSVCYFDAFSHDNDPWGEHDFGSFTHRGVKYFWKWDYYDLDMRSGSPDPANEEKTRRVLTIMLADEY